MVRPSRVALVVLLAVSALAPVDRANAQDPKRVLAGMIVQLQTGTPNPAWFGKELWLTIALQTGYTGVYPQLRQLGPVRNIVVERQQDLRTGVLYAMTAYHSQGTASWVLGLSRITNRIEYADFNIRPARLEAPLEDDPPDPPPARRLPPSSQPESEACRKFPNLC